MRYDDLTKERKLAVAAALRYASETRGVRADHNGQWSGICTAVEHNLFMRGYGRDAAEMASLAVNRLAKNTGIEFAYGAYIFLPHDWTQRAPLCRVWADWIEAGETYSLQSVWHPC